MKGMDKRSGWIALCVLHPKARIFRYETAPSIIKLASNMAISLDINATSYFIMPSNFGWRGVQVTYTVKQLADLAEVSRRTLHYYDRIGLLLPEEVAKNGYRYYGEGSLLRLQQILFYKELGFGLEEIGEILSDPDFDLLRALESHRLRLEERGERLKRLIQTVDRTIMGLKGEIPMDDKGLFEGFEDEQEKKYAQEAVDQWGDEARQSLRKWNDYGREKQATIRAEGEAVYQDMIRLIGSDPGSPKVQAVVARWHRHLGYFYEPSKERLFGLAEMYVEEPRFRATFDRMDPRLAEFMRRAVRVYCENL
jgi:DNA-binding transcriptional MerR regulator